MRVALVRWGTATGSRVLPPPPRRCSSVVSGDASSDGSAWTSSSSRRPGRARATRRSLRHRVRGRADRDRLGPVVRHDQLRDRDQDGRQADQGVDRGRGQMSTRRSFVYTAGGLGAAAVAALATGVVVERRVVRARRAGGARPTGSAPCGPSRSRSRAGTAWCCTWRWTRCGRTSSGSPVGTWGRRSSVHGYALNLDCWHFQREALRGKHRMVFFDQRSHGRSGRSEREHANIDQLGDDLAEVMLRLPLRVTSSSWVTRWEAWRSSRSPSGTRSSSPVGSRGSHWSPPRPGG